MAKMFPESLDFVNCPSYAERHLYELFQEQLSDHFTVFHSVKWQIKDAKQGATDGETDFVIAHPKLGILILEVKGGAIKKVNNQWYSNNKSIKDPFHQASNNKYSLLSLLKQQNYWKQRWISLGHAVAFPDVRSNNLALNAPPEIILDGTCLNNLSNWVNSVMNYWQNQEKSTHQVNQLASKGVEELIRLLNRSIYLPNLMNDKIKEREQELKQLSQQQFRLLNYLEQHRRVAISGCAGSGKTLLAIEKARRLNNLGFSVLLTCFNKDLAAFLRQSLGNKEGLHICTFHALCDRLAKNAGYDLSNYQRNKEFYETIYPELLIDAAEKLNWKVDAIIVDEGQDFTELWWLALKCLLKNPDEDTFYFFYDDNQNIYRKKWHPPLEQYAHSLNENWRNTKKIHAHVLNYYNGQNSLIALGQEGQDIEIQHYKTNEDLKKKLGRVLQRLINTEKIASQDIVILAPERIRFLENKYIDNLLITAQPRPNTRDIEYHTIQGFKGLERPVVILIEYQLNTIPRSQNLLYVGTSRASYHLIIFRLEASL